MISAVKLWPSDKTLAKIANVLDVELHKLFVPQKLIMQSESINELKHAIIKTVENLVHDTLSDWKISKICFFRAPKWRRFKVSLEISAE